MHLSRNCPFSNKTNLHLELPGRICIVQVASRPLRCVPFDTQNPPEKQASTCSCYTPWSATGCRRSKLHTTPLAACRWQRCPPPPPRAKTSATGGSGMGCDRALGGRGVAATPLQHTRNCGKSCDGGVATPWRATGGGGV